MRITMTVTFDRPDLDGVVEYWTEELSKHTGFGDPQIESIGILNPVPKLFECEVCGGNDLKPEVAFGDDGYRCQICHHWQYEKRPPL